MRLVHKKMEGRWLFAGVSRTQHSGIPGYGRNPQNLRNSGVAAGRNTIIYNQGARSMFNCTY